MSPPRTAGFLTDSTLCIGCKACEVACKEWNEVPEDGLLWSGLSYDNTCSLGASTWRHVKFVEQEPAVGHGGNDPDRLSWQFSSDVCKHCEVAGCLEACPTGAIVRTEMGGVFVQSDVCNGCGYCVVGCPFGVVAKREGDGRAFKCTFCYDRQKAGLEPACAKVCPTESILFGELDELRQRADERVAALHRAGMDDATLWDPRHTSVEGTHAIFVVRGDPRAYNLPPDPEVPTVHQRDGWRAAAVAAAGMAALAALAFLAGGGESGGATSS
ncbi:MAG TPA: 4Fe-4S dicluster domain-containing protein [Thermoanaerobaculia bacterium]|nr:4Fe-4S dicluster domain-containing protein [Thermoanaerobaculia bacterium]